MLNYDPYLGELRWVSLMLRLETHTVQQHGVKIRAKYASVVYIILQKVEKLS